MYLNMDLMIERYDTMYSSKASVVAYPHLTITKERVSC